MKFRYLILALVGAMALSLGAVACGGDDDDDGGNGGGELTLAEYFSELETLSQAFDADGEALDEQAGVDFEGTEGDEEAIDVFVDFIDDTKNLVKDFVNDIDGLNAPAEAADAHAEAVTAGQELGDMYDNALTVLDTYETFEEATFVLEAPGFVDAEDRFGAACIELQDIATANDIDVDLACPSDF